MSEIPDGFLLGLINERCHIRIESHTVWVKAETLLPLVSDLIKSREIEILDMLRDESLWLGNMNHAADAIERELAERRSRT
jgi:hypothetical protein